MEKQNLIIKPFNTKKFNNFFLIFCIFIFSLSTYWLYQKHLIGNDSTISEWLINYQGGFTRRGLIGEICFRLADYFDLKLRFVIFLFQTIVCFTYTLLLYCFIRDLPKNTLTVVAIFSPIFILYPLGEIEVLIRKEVFLFIGFVVFLILSSPKKNKTNSMFYVFFIFPLLLLIWEPFIFFIPFTIFILLIDGDEHQLKKNVFKISLCLSSSFFTVIYIIMNPLSPEQHMVMSNGLMDRFGEHCYMSCSLLKTKSSVAAQFMAVFNNITFTGFFRYFMIMLIGFFPLMILIYNSFFKKLFFLNKFEKLLIPFSITLLLPISLFTAMTDWGRVVNMIYTFSILTFLFLIKNDLIKLNDKVLYFDYLYKTKKKIFIILFYVFAFGWNPKTQIRGDIATNTLYKILYNSSKHMFDFKSKRFFQNSPLIKFHKKYFE